MTKLVKSNITFSSNIADSINFAQNVLDWKSLVMLKNKKKFCMTEIQKQLFHSGAQPYFCHNNDEIAWGFIKNENGEIVQSCRCEKKSCKHFDECMSEKYAKKIIRNLEVSNFPEELLVQPKWGEI